MQGSKYFSSIPYWFAFDLENERKNSIGDFKKKSEYNSEDFEVLTFLICRTLEARNIDYPLLEQHIFSENFNESNDSIFNFEEILSNKLLKLLNLNSEEDRDIIESYVDHITSFNEHNDLLKLKEIIYNLFSSIKILYYLEKNKKENLLKTLLNPHQTKLYKEFLKKDKQQKGYLNFKDVKIIFESLKVEINPEMIEYLVILMKNKNPPSIFDLNYLSLLQMLCEENDIGEQEETKSNYQITYPRVCLDSTNFLTLTPEYEKRITQILQKFSEFLSSSNLSLENFFKQREGVITYFVEDKIYNAISLKMFVKILNEEAKLDLDESDSLYILYKFKHDDNSFKSELIDLDILKSELELDCYKDYKNNLTYGSKCDDHEHTQKPKLESKKSFTSKIIEQDVQIYNIESEHKQLHESGNVPIIINPYFNKSISNVTQASFLLLNENNLVRENILNENEIITGLSDFPYENSKDKNKGMSKIIVDDMFTKVLEGI